MLRAYIFTVKNESKLDWDTNLVYVIDLNEISWKLESTFCRTKKNAKMSFFNIFKLFETMASERSLHSIN